MKEKLVKTLILVFSFIIILVLFITMKKNNNMDTVSYEGKTYALLEYNMDIFTYYHNSNSYYEEDLIYPLSHNKWDAVYFNGDLFILDKQVKDAIKYYANDKNYDWYIVFDNGDSEIKESISISDKELSYLYNIENIDKKDTIIFEQIEMFADILKISKDGFVKATITLAQVDNHWVYKTEIMTDDDREYVIKICDSLEDKINNLLK